MKLATWWLVMASGGSLAWAAGITGAWSLERDAAQANYRLTFQPAGALPPTSIEFGPDRLFFPEAALQSAGTKVDGILRPDAGVITLSGAVEAGGRARGQFEFRESLQFVEELMVISSKWWDARLLFDYAVRGVGVEDLRRIRELGLRRLDPQDLDRFLDRLPSTPHKEGVAALNAERDEPRKPQFRAPGPEAPAVLSDEDRDLLRAYRQSGYPLFRSDLDRLKGHGVSPDMLRQLKLSGYDVVNVNDMVRLQNFGVTQHDLRLLELQGKRNLTIDEIVKAKVNGIR